MAVSVQGKPQASEGTLAVGTKLKCVTAARGNKVETHLVSSSRRCSLTSRRAHLLGSKALPCEIVQVRKAKNEAGEAVLQYYVHFINCECLRAEIDRYSRGSAN